MTSKVSRATKKVAPPPTLSKSFVSLEVAGDEFRFAGSCGATDTLQLRGTKTRPKKVAKIAKKLGILVISDEVYGHMTFGCNPFVPMGAFGHIAPVITLGSISKRWAVPGWRAGWMVLNDPNGVLKKMKVVECMENYLDNTANPPTFVQAALPQILNMKDGFFQRTTDILRQTADVCYRKLKEIDCITCPYKPEGSMFLMVKLHLDKLVDIDDDVDFCCKLAKEEQVIILPGCAVGLKNWMRIMFAVEPTLLDDGLARLKSFCLTHKA